MACYEEDLAYVHDAGFTGFVRDASPALLGLLADHGVAEGPIVDLGCGSGVWAATLVEQGYDVWGLDRSAAMIDLARDRCPGGTFVVGSCFDVELPACRAVTAVGECFNYVGREDESLPALLRLVHGALAPGGLLVFDMALPGRVGSEPTRGHVLADDWAVLFEAVESDGELVRTITVFRAAGETWRRSDEVHRLRLVPADDVLDLLDAAGFDSERRDAYGERAMPEGQGVFVARHR